MSTILQQNIWLVRAVILLMVAGTVALAAYTYQALQHAHYASERTASINVHGTGEVMVVPDIGTFRFSVIEEAETAEAAQAAATELHNDIMEYLKDTADVAESDIKTTGYNLQPRYRFLEPEQGVSSRERELVGYEVRQTVEVLVRDTDVAGELIVGVGERGASDISNLEFTIDDESVYVDEARELAISDATARAERLADQLGVRLVRVLDYYEESVNVPPFMPRAEMMQDMAVEEAAAPDLPVGENEIMRRVNITYEVR